MKIRMALSLFAAVALSFLVTIPSQATALLDDMLTYDGVESAVWAPTPSKLEFPYNEKVRRMAIEGNICSSSMGSPRGRWRIADGKLWLDGFRGCSTAGASISSVYGVAGPMWAEWVNADIATYRGETLCSGVWGEVGIAQKTLNFHIEKGRVINATEKDNSRDPRVPNLALLASYLQIQDPKFNDKEARQLRNSSSRCTGGGASEKIKAIATHLAPGGTLRASIDLSNPIFSRRDQASGKVIGISVDLAVALASDFQIPLTLVFAKSLEDSISDVARGVADFGIFPIESVSNDKIWVGRAFARVDAYYTVRADSAAATNAQIDSATMKIAVSEHSIYEQYLSKEIRNATIVRIPEKSDLIQSFLQQDLSAAAGIMYQLEPAELKRLNLRVIEPAFMTRHLAIGVSLSTSMKEEGVVIAYLTDFTDIVKRTLSWSIKRHRQEDAVTIDEYDQAR